MSMKVKWPCTFPERWEILPAKRLFPESKERAAESEEQLSATQNYGVIPQAEFMRLAGRRVVQLTQNLELRKLVEVGDFVISMRSFQGGLERAWATGGIRSSYVVLKPRSDLVRGYYQHLFKSQDYIQALQSTANFIRDGQDLNYQNFVLIDLPYPPVSEQSQIARFLDYETARIDALIAEQERLIELLKEKRQAVISHAVTKGLDPTAPMKDSGVEWLGEVPAHWVIKSYRYCSEIYRGKFGHRPRNDPSLYDGDFAFIQTGDIARANKYITAYKQTLNEKGANVSQKFPAGTLVMAIAANIGDTAILGFEAYAPDSVVGFKPNEDTEIEFLRFSFMAAIQELHKTSTQSAQANLNIDRIGSVRAVFPPLVEQAEIVEYLDRELEKYSELEHQAVKSIYLMQERRSALISAAVTGKIDVRGWQAPEGDASAAPRSAAYG